MSNVEGMQIADFIKKTEQSETTLRYSTVHYSAVLRFVFYLCRISYEANDDIEAWNLFSLTPDT
jgi:hypothetical protein